VTVGPHPQPWPDDPRLDARLLAEGDSRNVIDEYRYWSREAIIADLDLRRHPFHVAVENWEHDFNIGTVVRNANAFLAAGVHIVGRRRWNRRGAMVTDRYQHEYHHANAAALASWATAHDLVVVGVDNVAGSVPLERTPLPERAMLVFGQEGPGLSPEMVEVASMLVAITQYGSTRSLNAGVASGIAMYAWVRQHVG
jgi:tRNA G18 (ribose-2'-O)-methylase SpoU